MPRLSSNIQLVRIAASQSREFRGWILDMCQQPMYARQIAETLGLSDDSQVPIVENLLKVLCTEEVGLVELCEFRQTCADLRKSTEICAPLYNETETKDKRTEKKEVSDVAPIVSDSADVSWFYSRPALQ